MAPSLRKRRGLLATSLVLLWLLPTLLVGFYFFFQASNQYWVGAQFSVRGTSTGSLADLGLDFLPSSGTQSSDSYIVADYISSVQLVEDLRDQLDIDLRQFYARPEIDWLYRIDPDMPLEEFAGYWAWQVDVSFNSTTGTTDLIVQAFTAEDAKTIADAILVVSERLINDLSASAREQLISTAQAEVSRTEERLGAVRRKMRDFRNREQSLDPTQLGVREASIVATLEAQLAELKTRRRTLVGTISSDSPSIRVLDREIAAIETQISEQLARIGSGQSAESGTTSDEASSTRNLSAVLDEYLELSLEEEFAVKAYTASLTSLEAADADARKMQRYFATYVFPKLPTTSLHPRRLLWTAAASFWFLCIWAVAYFVTRSVRDHAI